jgi:hypothetical protein
LAKFARGRGASERVTLMTSTSGLFDSAWLKWGWAVHEAILLERDLAQFIQHTDFQGLHAVRCEYDPKRHGFILTLDHVPPPPPWFGLRLSAVAHNYRSALDNLAWALVSRGSTPPETLRSRQRRAIAFPLCESREDFNNSLTSTRKKSARLPGIRRADAAIIRRAQPYRYADRNRPFHSLVILQKLNNFDKHRTLQPVYFLPDYFAWEPVEIRDCEVIETIVRARRRILEIGAELGRLPARKIGPEPYLQMEYQIAPLPALNERVALGEWLTKVNGLIGGLLAVFAQPPHNEFRALGLPTRIIAK